MIVALIVLAAGQGSRMQSDLPKVLHRLGGVPLVGHALARYEEIVGLELLDERLPDLALGAIGEAGCFGDGYGQARALPRSKNDCVDCTC